MTVGQLRRILSILDDDTEVKVTIDSYAFRDKDCFISGAEVVGTDNDSYNVSLLVGTRPLPEENKDDK